MRITVGILTPGNQSLVGRRDDRTCVNQLLPQNIDLGVETSQRPGTQNRQVTWLRKNHLIDGKKLVGTNDGKSDASRESLTIGHRDRNVFLFALHSNLFERLSGYAGVIAAGVNEKLINRRRFAAMGN